MTPSLNQTVWIERALVNSLVMRAQDGHRDWPTVTPDLLADEQAAAALRSYLNVLHDGHAPLFVTLVNMPGGEIILNDLDGINSTMWEDYDREVLDLWRARRKIELTNLARARVASARTLDDIDLSDIKAQAEALTPILEEDRAAASIESKAEQMNRWALDPTKLIGVTSGMAEIDSYTAGLRPQLHVVAGRPGMGKTSFKVQCVMGQLKAGLHVYDVQLEDGPGDAANRMALQELEVDKHQLAKPDIRKRYLNLMAEIRDNPNLTWHEGAFTSEAVAEGVAKASKVKRPVECVWIDHLSYMHHPMDKSANLAYRIGQTTKRLQRMAVDLGIPVMLMSQLSRNGADGNPPDLPDLRDSGEIEQDARHVWFLHRPGYYSDEPQPNHLKQPVELWLRKTQDMPTGRILMMWLPACARFYPPDFQISGSERLNHVRG